MKLLRWYLLVLAVEVGVSLLPMAPLWFGLSHGFPVDALVFVWFPAVAGLVALLGVRWYGFGLKWALVLGIIDATIMLILGQLQSSGLTLLLPAASTAPVVELVVLVGVYLFVAAEILTVAWLAARLISGFAGGSPP